MWRRNIQAAVKVFQVGNCDRLMQLDLTTRDGRVTLLNVYMPTDYRDLDSRDEYGMMLGLLHNMIVQVRSSTCMFAVIGDFNANSHGSRFYNDLKEFCDDTGMFIADVSMLPPSSFTFISATGRAKSWLDHCIFSPMLCNKIERVKIRYDFSTKDHLPLELKIAVLVEASLGDDDHDLDILSLNWEVADAHCLLMYNELISLFVTESGLEIYNRVLNECNSACTESEHQNIIAFLCDLIVTAMIDAANLSIPHKARFARQYIRPGWNDTVKDAHVHARHAFLIWKTCGSPVEGIEADNMRSTRASFKYAFRACKNNADSFKADILTRSLQGKRNVEFWRLVNRDLGGRVCLPSVMNGVSGGRQIAKNVEGPF